jgi:hypothetical protein
MAPAPRCVCMMSINLSILLGGRRATSGLDPHSPSSCHKIDGRVAWPRWPLEHVSRKRSSFDSPLEGTGFEPVWGFPCQVVFLV